MARCIAFTVPGSAQPKQRPRVMKSGITFTPKETVHAEAFVRGLALEAMAGDAPLEGPVRLCVRIYRAIPKSFSKRKRDQAVGRIVLPTTRPDL